MFGLFKSKRNRLADKSAKAFDRVLSSLKGMADEEIAGVLDIAAQIKSSSFLLAMARDDPYAESIYRDPIMVPEDMSLEQLKTFEQQIMVWSTEGVAGMAKVGAISIWYLSLAAGTFAEQRYLGRQMWWELSRGFPHCTRFEPNKDAVVGLEPREQET